MIYSDDVSNMGIFCKVVLGWKSGVRRLHTRAPGFRSGIPKDVNHIRREEGSESKVATGGPGPECCSADCRTTQINHLQSHTRSVKVRFNIEVLHIKLYSAT